MGKLHQTQLNRMAVLFFTLSDPARLRILHCLRDGPRCVGEIHGACHLKQANTSKHLRILREAKLVAPHREGTTIHYTIIEPLIFALCDLACGNSGQKSFHGSPPPTTKSPSSKTRRAKRQQLR